MVPLRYLKREREPLHYILREENTMKELTNYRRTVQYLQKIYNLINEEYFNNELEEVTLTVMESTQAYGHISVSNTWFTEDGKGMRELNISAQYLTRPIENVVATLIHEASHLYNMQHGIRDTSGYYHNRRFKETAENIGHLQIDKDARYGWTITEPTEATLDFCIKHDLTDIKVGKAIDWTVFGIGGTATGTTGTAKPKTRKKGNSIKMICPKCGAIARVTRTTNLICGDCMEHMIEA